MFYKNISYSEKTFYGVTFKPGEVAEVPGYVNDLHMIIAEKPSKKQTVASDNAPAVTSKKDDKKDGKKESSPSKDQNESVSEQN